MNGPIRPPWTWDSVGLRDGSYEDTGEHIVSADTTSLVAVRDPKIADLIAAAPDLLEAVREQHGASWCVCQNTARGKCWISRLLERLT